MVELICKSLLLPWGIKVGYVNLHERGVFDTCVGGKRRSRVWKKRPLSGIKGWILGPFFGKLRFDLSRHCFDPEVVFSAQ
jgi:hypothetical protein